jgi:hypothetical protein
MIDFSAQISGASDSVQDRNHNTNVMRFVGDSPVSSTVSRISWHLNCS